MKNAYIASEAGESHMGKVRYQPYQKQPERRKPPDDGLWTLVGCVFISAGLLLLFQTFHPD